MEGLAQLQEEAKAWRLRCEMALALRDLGGAAGAFQQALPIAFAIDNRARLTKKWEDEIGSKR